MQEPPTIRFDEAGFSKTFVATEDRQVPRGRLHKGGRFCFWREDGRIALCHETGEPAFGNQYIEFDTLREARAFALHVGLMPERIED